MTSYGLISQWANSKSNHYTPSALNEFLDVDEADAFLVAYTLHDSTNRILVTHEISQPESKKKVKIPEACIALNVTFLNAMDMFRYLQETF